MDCELRHVGRVALLEALPLLPFAHVRAVGAVLPLDALRHFELLGRLDLDLPHLPYKSHLSLDHDCACGLGGIDDLHRAHAPLEALPKPLAHLALMLEARLEIAILLLERGA